jgi:uncharacterized membrane protein YbhN (UPF0104 family)
VLAVLLWRLGAGPFLDGVRRVDATALVAAAGLGAVTTVLSAWRWRLVAAALGADLPLGAAVAHCYRSIFLNSTLPCGVLGDVHRAVSHGRDSGDVVRGVRAVVWERTAGQAVQAAASLLLLTLLPSPVQRWMPLTVVTTVAGGALALAAAARFRVVSGDLKRLLRKGTWPGVAGASLLVVAGHLATFLLAARTTGTDVSPAVGVPLGLLALLAMGIPANVGGFGPREGMAAWSFGAAGLGAAQGVAAGTAYGVLVLAAALPGLFVLLAGRRSRRIGGAVHV